MKLHSSLIIYNSRSGYTAQYAKWLSEALGCEAREAKSIRPSELKGYGIVVYGGSVRAGAIRGLAQFKKQLPALHGKKLAVFAVGLAPAGSKQSERLFQNLFPPDVGEVPCFYLQGGIDVKKLSFINHLVMNMLVNSIKKQRNPTQDQLLMKEAIETSADFSTREQLDPLLTAVRRMESETE